MNGKAVDTMTVIKSICSGIGALSAVLLCVGVLWSEMGDMDNEKLDKEVFMAYRDSHEEQTGEYRRENNDAHDRIEDVVYTIQSDVAEIKAILKERDK